MPFTERETLQQLINDRLAQWHRFNRQFALPRTVYCTYNIYPRIRRCPVRTCEQHADPQGFNKTATQQDSREKDPRSLSGGENSFSTICLLLSLWESISCPIRCLNEFDVFMDTVNRRISMKMMIDTANASRGKQYVLITPQDMTNISPGATVRVHRMSDPERGQSTLTFS